MTAKAASASAVTVATEVHSSFATVFIDSVVVGLMAFLTVVDLFATKAILPSLTQRYGVDPATMGLAVNACTFGMAGAGLTVALAGRRINRRQGIVVSLVLLALPTALLAVAPDVITFAALRVVQGVLMATAFTLSLAYLGEAAPMGGSSGAVAAYITGNVASNLFGRLLSAYVADAYGLASSFAIFATLNLLGAVLAFATLKGMSGASLRPRGDMPRVPTPMAGELSSWLRHLRVKQLRAAFMVGFCILFAFIGTFTYVNFVLVLPPLSLGMMQVGLVYLVFLPSILTTPLAGRLSRQLGVRRALTFSFGVALIGLPMLLAPRLIVVLAGLSLIGAGTFFAQALTTGAVGRLASDDPGSASGLYLASYFLGGLAGSAVLGQVFVHGGWPATVAGIGAMLTLAAVLACVVDGSSHETQRNTERDVRFRR